LRSCVFFGWQLKNILGSNLQALQNCLLVGLEAIALQKLVDGRHIVLLGRPGLLGSRLFRGEIFGLPLNRDCNSLEFDGEVSHSGAQHALLSKVFD
jgi:hypothetical protein